MVTKTALIAIVFASLMLLSGITSVQAIKTHNSPLIIIEHIKVDRAESIYEHTVILRNVGSAPSPAAVILEVDGRLENIAGTENFNGLKITVVKTHYAQKISQRHATLTFSQI